MVRPTRVGYKRISLSTTSSVLVISSDPNAEIECAERCGDSIYVSSYDKHDKHDKIQKEIAQHAYIQTEYNAAGGSDQTLDPET